MTVNISASLEAALLFTWSSVLANKAELYRFSFGDSHATIRAVRNTGNVTGMHALCCLSDWIGRVITQFAVSCK